jgi:hypothetical protein
VDGPLLVARGNAAVPLESVHESLHQIPLAVGRCCELLAIERSRFPRPAIKRIAQSTESIDLTGQFINGDTESAAQRIGDQLLARSTVALQPVARNLRQVITISLFECKDMHNSERARGTFDGALLAAFGIFDLEAPHDGSQGRDALLALAHMSAEFEPAMETPNTGRVGTLERNYVELEPRGLNRGGCPESGPVRQ